MPRQSRLVVTGLAHHVTQRGNYRQKIFQKESDYHQYAQWFCDYSAKYDLKVVAHCLMGNHVHFIVIPSKQDSLARTFNAVHMRYAQYIHRRSRRSGHLWQGRFYSCILDEMHLYRAIRYVERNPVRAKMVKKPWDYPWSSARMHVGEEDILAIPLFEEFQGRGKEWKEYLLEEDEGINEEIRLKTKRGMIVGTTDFIRKLECQLKRPLECLNPGRPRKKKEE